MYRNTQNFLDFVGAVLFYTTFFLLENRSGVCRNFWSAAEYE